MKTITVISHANCTDGMMAAFWYYLHYKFNLDLLNKVQFIFLQYNEEIPVIEGDLVIVVDFSFTRLQLEDEKFKDKQIKILDHHESSAASYFGHGYGHLTTSCCNNTSTLKATFVKDNSGCGLAKLEMPLTSSEFFMDHKDRLQYVSDRIEDRDLWKFNFEDTKAVYELVNSVPKTFEAWEELLINISNEEFQARLNEMKIRVKMREELALYYSKLATIVPYGNKTIGIVNCASNFASEVGNILSKQHAFSVMFVVVPKDKLVIASLRSNIESGINVSIIAKRFGGGGHENSAGFSFNYEEEPNKLLELTTGRLFN